MKPVLQDISYECPFCGESNEVEVDLTAGARQTMIEDCTVCCRPARLRVNVSDEGNVELLVDSDT